MHLEDPILVKKTAYLTHSRDDVFNNFLGGLCPQTPFIGTIWMNPFGA